ncbi:MAG: BCD family MFS transporter [Alphaproteobacteria bacterium]
MSAKGNSWVQMWMGMGTKVMPFADAASEDLPLGRLLRLGLFQVSVGMAIVLLTGTLNRVMIVELGVPTWLVALMISLPIVFAPFRALIGHRSDIHRSVIGWRRVPYLLIGTMLQFGGLAIMPFTLLVLSGDTHTPPIVGQLGAALAFLLLGAGVHTTQTAGLALATDLARPEDRPRVVALLYVMLLLGMVVSALIYGVLLSDFNQLKLVQAIQGSAVVVIALNAIALWKQEGRNPHITAQAGPRPTLAQAWANLRRGGQAGRLLLVTGLGTVAFSMQDVLLEPYGGEILSLSVSATTTLTAMFAAGTLAGFAYAAWRMSAGGDPLRLSAFGLLGGIAGLSGVIFADPLASALLFRTGTVLIGFGAGLFIIGTLTAAMDLAERSRQAGGDALIQGGLALGAWGAVQATATGAAIAAGGALRDIVSGLAAQGALGPALSGASAGYSFVYHLEILLLFATLALIGPLVRVQSGQDQRQSSKFGLAELPG